MTGDSVEDAIRRARRAPGPIVVVGRPRSGTRALARLLVEAGVFIGGAVSPDYLDAIGPYQRFVVPLLASRHFPDWPDLDGDATFTRFCRERLADALAQHFTAAEPAGPWGWKYPETLFTMPIVKRLLPGARFVHIVRDGRDVCLSEGGFWQLTGPHRDPAGWSPPPLDASQRPDGAPSVPSYRNFCFALTFGDASRRRFADIDLGDRRQLVDHRFLLQMQSWVHCVTAARSYGRALGDDYVELRYEDLCRNPVEVGRALLDHLGLPLDAPARAWLDRGVGASRLRRWEAARFTPAEARDFARAVALGAPLLRELGYEAP